LIYVPKICSQNSAHREKEVERRGVRGEEERSDDYGYGGLEKLRAHQ
jgi:hypothetical protein